MDDFDQRMWIDVILVIYESTLILHLIVPDSGFVLQVIAGMSIGFIYPILRFNHYKEFLIDYDQVNTEEYLDYDQRLIELGLMESNHDPVLNSCCLQTKEHGRFYCICGRTVVVSINPLVFK